jgi:cytochrome c556
MLRSTLLLLALPLLLTACGEPEDTRPGQPVTQRRAAFKEILKSFEPMGLQLRNQRYDAKQFSILANNLNQAKDGPWSHFGPDTNYPPTKAKAALWSEPEKFAASSQSFIKAAEALVVAAASQDVKQITPAYEALHDTCRTCHKSFKE